MPITEPRDYLPLWGLLSATVVVIGLSMELGYRIGQYRRRNSEGEMEAPVGAMVAATLGLLSFILAFTFGLAASRFDARRQLVVDEANAIGTTYLRAGLLPDARGVEIRKLLREYVHARLDAVESGDWATAMSRSDELHRKLWKEAEALGQQHPHSQVVTLFILSLNQTIDIHATRVHVSIRSRLPAVLWGVLDLVAILTMAGVGYYGGLTNSRRSPASVVLVLTFAAIMAMVADLDRPQEGLLKVSQQAMIDLRNSMND